MDKTVIITGSNSGIGKAAAFRFAEEGYRVVMACRNLEKSTTVQHLKGKKWPSARTS